MYPSLDKLLKDGASPEWFPFVFISCALILLMICQDIYLLFQHKKYSTKCPIQFFCTVGILQVYPFFALMQLVSLVTPNSHHVVSFFTDAQEALSFLFFLRLLFTYMGGKKAAMLALKGEQMHLNVPPICCLFCLPTVRFTKKFFFVCELLVGLHSFFCISVGFIDLLISLDNNTSSIARQENKKFVTSYHALSMIFLMLAIYGLSGIYHSAEEKLHNRGVVRKFLVYKIFTLSVKLEDLLMVWLVKSDIINDDNFKFNKNFDAELRVKGVYAFFVVVQASIAFPLAAKFYSTEDYEKQDQVESNEMREESGDKTKDGCDEKQQTEEVKEGFSSV